MEKEQEFNFGEEQQEDTVEKKNFFIAVKEKYLSLPKYAQIIIPVVVIVVVLLIIYFLIFSSPSFSLKILVDGKQFSDVGSISLFTNNGKLEFTVENGLILFETEKGTTVTVKIKLTDGTITKQIIANKKDLVLNITTNKSEDSFATDEKKENVFSFFFSSKNGVLNKAGKIKIACEDYSQELPVANGKLENIKIPCNIVSVVGNIEGIPPVSQSCNPGMCKLMFEDSVSSDVKLQQNLVKSKLIIYVNYKDGNPAKEISVEVREDSIGNELLDLGKTKDFGSFTTDLTEGKYVVIIADPSGKYASQQKNVTMPSSPINFVLDTPAIGNINVSFDVEDNNVLSGNAIMKDENNTFLETKTFDTNSSLFFAIKEKGTYKLSFSLAQQFTNEYVAEDSIAVYDKESGDLNITQKIRKVNSFTDQNVVVQVIDSSSKDPIPFAKIWFENSKLEFLSSIGFVETDINGVFSKILSEGTYVVKLKHPYLSGQQSFNVEETKSLTMTSKFVTLPVAWGNADIEVCLKDLTGDAFIDVYSLSGGLQSSFFIEKDKSCAQTSVKSLETVYVHVVKDGYFEQYSQAVFLQNNEKKSLEIILTPIKPNLPQAQQESNFIGIYTTSLLTDEAKELKPLNDYFYAFKLKLPKNTTKGIKFVGVVGDLKDENAINSKMQVRLLNSVGSVSYFEHFSPNKKAIEENENVIVLDNEFIYSAKSFTSTYSLDKTPESETEIVYVVRVSVTNNVVLSKFGGDTLLFSYWFGFEDETYNLKNLNKVVKKIGTLVCEEAICINAYFNKTPIDIDAPVEVEKIGNIFAKVSFANKAETNISIYNSPESGNVKKKSDLTSLNIALDGKVVENTISGTPKTNNLNFGPLYLESVKVQQGSYLDFNTQFDMLTPDASSIEFRVFDNNWESANGTDNIKLIPTPTKELKVEGVPEFVVPYVANKINLNVLGDDSVPIVGAEVKYYSYESANWKYEKTAKTNDGGTAEFETEPIGLGDKIKIVISADDYKLFTEEKTADFNFLKTAQELKATILYPDDQAQVYKEVEVENTSDYDLNIFNLKYYWDSKMDPELLANLVKTASMEKAIVDNGILKAKSKLKMLVSYDAGILSSLTENVLVAGKMYFNYIPISASTNYMQEILDTKLEKSLPISLDFRFKGSPEDGCLIFDFEKEAKKVNEIIFLDSKEEQFDLVVQNTCTSNNLSFDFSDVLLQMNTNTNMVLTISKEGKEIASGDLITGVVPLKDATKSNTINKYNVKIAIPDTVDFNSLLNITESFNLNFGILGNYYSEGNKKEQTYNASLNLSFKTLDTCLTFGLGDVANSEDYILKDNGLETDILRLPYYFKNERNGTSGNIILDDDGSDEELQGTLVFNNDFETNVLPLKVENSCGKDLTVQVCKNDDNYCKFEDGANDQFVPTTPFSELQVNAPTIIPNSTFKMLDVLRQDGFSGAIVLPLYVFEENKKTLIKEVKINVESSPENSFFVKNPFILKGNKADSVVYENKYYPEGFENFANELGSQDSVLSWDSSKTFFCSFFGGLDLCLDNYGNWQDNRLKKFSEFGFEVLFDKESQYMNSAYADDDELSGFRYAVHQDNIPTNFELGFEVTKKMSQDEMYKFVKPIGDEVKKNQEFPYFVNIGIGLLEGDSGDNVYTYANTFCPNDFEPVRIYLDSYENDLDCFGDNFKENNLENSIKEYTYGGTICLDEDGINDNAYGQYKMLTICRLKKELFNNSFNRPIVSENLKNVRIYTETPKPKFAATENAVNCFGGGITGKAVEPKLSFTENQNIDCNLGSKFACNMPQFANYIISSAKGSIDDTIQFRAQLLYDNYSKEIFDKYKQGFLQGSDYNINFLTYSGNQINILQTGIYDVKIIKKSTKELDVYLAYDSYILPDHLFYYLPFVENVNSSGIGTFVDSVLTYVQGKTYPLADPSIASLFNYHLENNLPQNVTTLPTVLSGIVNLSESGGGNGEINFVKSNLYIKKLDFSKDNNLAEDVSGLTTYLKLFVKKGNEYYPADLYFDIKIEEKSITEKTIKVNKLFEEDVDLFLVYMSEQGSGSPTKTVNKLKSLQDVSKELSSENICYLYKDNRYVYYWNIFKIIWDLQK